MKRIGNLRFWCQKVLPLVYDNSLSYYELLCKIVDKLNEVIEITNNFSDDIASEVDAVLNEWLADGTIEDILEQTVDNLEPRISALETTVKYLDPIRLRGQKIVFFGDSWTVGGSASSTNYRFSSLLTQMFGMSEENFGVGGAGFTRSGNLISSQVVTAVNDMSESDRNKVPVVVLCGGINDLRNMDSTDRETFMANASSTCSDIHAAFPNALIVAVISNTTLTGMTAEKLRWITGAQERIQYHKSYPILVCDDCYNWVRGRADWYKSDGMHLSDLGHGVWADKIAQVMMGNSTKIFDYTGNITFASGVSSSLDNAGYVFRDGAYCEIQDTPLTFSTAITERTLIGNLSETIAPAETNSYTPFYHGNLIVGSVGITTTGAIYLTPNADESISSGYVASMRWLTT